MKASTLRQLGRWSLTTYLVAFFVYLEAPLLIIVLASFNDQLTVRFPPTGFSLEWYRALWDTLIEAPGTKTNLVSSILTSIWLSVGAMIGSVLAGGLAAIGLHRATFRGRETARQILLLPLVFPQVVVGIGLLVWFSQIGGVPSWLRLLLGHLILTVPYVVTTTTASLQMLDRRLEEAAMNLGASSFAVFWHITLPLIAPGLISGGIFAMLVSFSNFTVSFFLYSGEQRPLPAWLFEFMQHFVDPSLAALSTFLVLLTLLVLLIVNRLVAVGRLVGLRAADENRGAKP
jgi:putative spermidine/putrescine transport system permease protein